MHPGVEAVIAARHEFVGFGVVETIASDAEAAHIHHRLAKGHIGASLAGGIVHDAWGARAKAFFEPYKHFGRFNDM